MFNVAPATSQVPLAAVLPSTPEMVTCWPFERPWPALVMVMVAQAVGVEPRSGADLTGQLAAALGNEDRLVVLDNLEHLLAAAPDVGQVLAACPRLRVLATSRERLRLSAANGGDSKT